MKMLKLKIFKNLIKRKENESRISCIENNYKNSRFSCEFILMNSLNVCHIAQKEEHPLHD